MKNPLSGIAMLIAGYTAGTVIGSLFSKNTGAYTQKSIAESDNKLKAIADNFVSTHKNLLSQVKSEVASEENKAIYEKYKNQIIDTFDSYRAKGETIVNDLKTKGETYSAEAKLKLKSLYNEKVAEIQSYTELGKEKIKTLTDKLDTVYKETEKEIKELKRKKT